MKYTEQKIRPAAIAHTLHMSGGDEFIALELLGADLLATKV